MMRGPRVFELGRLEQWARRLGRSLFYGAAMLHAYEEQVGQEFDPEQLSLASKIRGISDGFFGLVKVTEPLRLGQLARENILKDMIGRAIHFDNPNHLWVSDITTKFQQKH